MAQSGFTPISLYFSATGAAVPTAGNLVAGELALNTNDGKLYFKNSAGVVTLLAGSTSGPAGGSTTQVQYNNAGVLAGITGATSNGTALTLVAPNLGSPASVGTMPAFTLGGTVAGGGNQINNVVIGASTPLAGSFTTVSATGVSTLAGAVVTQNVSESSSPTTGGLTAAGGIGVVKNLCVGGTLLIGTDSVSNGVIRVTGAAQDMLLQTNGTTRLTIATGGAITIGGTLAAGATTVTGAISATGDITSTTGNVVIGTSGKGIDFSATTSGTGTMTSELFADYEEGTWTPTATFSGGNGTLSYTAQTGTYTKVGRLVTVNCRISFIKGTALGNLAVSDLPFTVGAGGGNNAGAVIGLVERIGLANNVITGIPDASTTNMSVLLTPLNSTASSAALTNTSIDAGVTGADSTLIFSLTYFV